MSKAKISPWPWKIYPTHNKIEIQDANAQPVAVVWSGEMRHGGHSKSRYMNARLLALAPKLLEECGNALRVLWRINNPDVGCTCHTDGHYCVACTTRDLETIVACASEVPDVFTVDPWCHKELHDGRAIDPAQGYTITPAAKPEAKPADDKCQAKAKPEILTDEAKPADVPTCAVHLRSDAHLSAVIGRVNGIADWMYALESRLAALEKPADKPAARVVKAPKADGMHTPVWWQGWRDADAAWRAAIAAVGVEYKESDNG